MAINIDPGAAAFRQSFAGIANILNQEKAKNDAFQQAIALEGIKQQIRQQDPLQNFLRTAQFVEAADKLGLDTTQFFGQNGSSQPITQNIQGLDNTGVAGQPVINQSSGQDIRPTTFKSTPSGTIKPTQFKDFALERQSEDEKADRSIKTQVRKDVLGRVAKLQGLLPVLDQFDQLLESVPVGTGISGRADALFKGASGFTQVDPFVTSIQSQADALRPQIARGFGDVGNLSVVEQKTAGKFIPRVTDSQDTRVMKSIGGLSFIKKKIEDAGRRGGLAEDKDFINAMKEIDRRLFEKIDQARQIGVDEKRLRSFIGQEGDKVPTKQEAVAELKRRGKL